MKVKRRSIRKCAWLQEKALDEFNELSCLVTMLTAALEHGSQDHRLWPGSLTALWDIQKSVDKAGRLLDRLGNELPRHIEDRAPLPPRLSADLP